MAEFEALALEVEASLLEFELFAPFGFGEGGFLEVLQVVEGALEGAFGLGAVALEEGEFMNVGGGDGVGFRVEGIEFGLAFGVGTLAAPEVPAGVDEVGDDGGIGGGGGFVRFERFGEEGVEERRVFAGDEESFGGGAVAEAVEASEGGGGEMVLVEVLFHEEVLSAPGWNGGPWGKADFWG